MLQTALSLPGYTVHQVLGQGGMARVYLATQLSLHRPVAIKVMDAQLESGFSDRFEREARLVAGLKHPHIVTIHDIGRLPDGRRYLSMEYLEGGDLRSRIRQGLSQDEARRVLREVAAGLAAVHAQGVIHRDIKPGNILFRADGAAVLTDFGIAKPLVADCELTQTGAVLGSPAYSSPEQLQAQALDARSDIYSLGVVLLEMLLGHNPFKADNYANTVLRQLQGMWELPPVLAGWRPLLQRMLAKSPQARFASVQALLAELEVPAGVDDEPTQLRAVVASARPAWRRRLPMVLALLLALGAGLLWSRHDSPEQRQLRDYLALAEQRLAADQLSLPVADNAIHYYQAALRLDPKNRAAQQGLNRVVSRYMVLIEEALAKRQLRQAREHLERALVLAPEEAGLLALQQRLEASRGSGRLWDRLFGG